jgi:hypothetical protein
VLAPSTLFDKEERPMPLKSSRIASLVLATLFVLSTVLVGLALAPSASAAQCSPPDQRTTFDCCSCNILKAVYWHCDSNGNWVQSGDACLYGQCCRYPCCV